MGAVPVFGSAGVGCKVGWGSGIGHVAVWAQPIKTQQPALLQWATLLQWADLVKHFSIFHLAPTLKNVKRNFPMLKKFQTWHGCRSIQKEQFSF
jgi:hypothetical protein